MNSTTPRSRSSPASATRRGFSGPSPSSRKRQRPGCSRSSRRAAAISVEKSLSATIRPVMTTLCGPASSRPLPGPRIGGAQALGIEGVVDDPAPSRPDAPGLQAGLAVRHDQRGHGLAELALQRPPGSDGAVADGRIDDGDAQQAAERQGGQRRHPVPGVHHVGTPLEQQAPQRQRPAARRTAPCAGRRRRDSRRRRSPSANGPPPMVHTRRSQYGGRCFMISASWRSAPPVGRASLSMSRRTPLQSSLTGSRPAGQGPPGRRQRDEVVAAAPAPGEQAVQQPQERVDVVLGRPVGAGPREELAGVEHEHGARAGERAPPRARSALQVAENVVGPRPQPQRLRPRQEPPGTAAEARGPRVPVLEQPRHPAREGVGRHDGHRQLHEARRAGAGDAERVGVVVAKVGAAAAAGPPGMSGPGDERRHRRVDLVAELGQKAGADGVHAEAPGPVGRRPAAGGRERPGRSASRAWRSSSSGSR